MSKLTFTLLTGSSAAKTLRMLKIMNVASISERTFYRHTSSDVNPVIIQQWRANQQSLLERLSESERGLVLAGHGRCDSPGYCAKFGSFTFIEEEINRVDDSQLVQVSTVPPWKRYELFLALNFQGNYCGHCHKIMSKYALRGHPLSKPVIV